MNEAEISNLKTKIVIWHTQLSITFKHSCIHHPFVLYLLLDDDYPLIVKNKEGKKL